MLKQAAYARYLSNKCIGFSQVQSPHASALKSLTNDQVKGRLVMGSKNLWHDAKWSRPAVQDIEMALLRAAAFPDFSRQSGLKHEFVVLDPSTREETPAHEDIIERISYTAAQMKIGATVVGNQSSARYGAGGFPLSSEELSGLPQAEFAAALATLRERIGWVLSGSRFAQNRHIFLPQFDYATLAIIIDLMSDLEPETRPFIHLASRHDATQLAHAGKFGTLERLGQAIYHLNADKPCIFLYGWSARVAQRLTLQSGIGVQPLDLPADPALCVDPSEQPDRLTVGFFSAARRESGFDCVDAVVRAANESANSARRMRFIVQIKPASGSEDDRAFVAAQRARLMSVPERNVTVIDEYMPRPLYMNAISHCDAIMVLHPASQGPTERVSLTAQNAMAAGKLVLSFEDVDLAGTVKSRVLKARDTRMMGEIITDLASELSSVRTASRVSRDAFSAMQRPSRLFAQLLYGPLILANAAGHDSI